MMEIFHKKNKEQRKIELLEYGEIVINKGAIIQRVNGNLRYANGFFVNNNGDMITIVHIPSVKRGENEFTVRLHNKKKIDAIVSEIIDESNDIAFAKAINYKSSFLNCNTEVSQEVNSKVRVVTLNKKTQWIINEGKVLKSFNFGRLVVFTVAFETWPICIGSPVFDSYGKCCGIVRANLGIQKTAWCVSYHSIYKQIWGK